MGITEAIIIVMLNRAWNYRGTFRAESEIMYVTVGIVLDESISKALSAILLPSPRRETAEKRKLT